MILHSKIIPRFSGEFVRWLNDEVFIVLVHGQEILGHKDYWWGWEDLQK